MGFNKNTIFLIVLIVAAVAVWLPLFASKKKVEGLVSPTTSLYRLSRENVAASVGAAVKLNAYPTKVDIPVGKSSVKADVQFSFDPRGQALAQKLMETWKPDYGVIVAMDAVTGRVLSMTSYTRGEPYLGNLALRAIFPSASVFKVVTASAAIDKHDVSPNTIIPFNGRSHTLYRRNVEETKFNRWTRYITLKEAFGKSINTVFAKLGVFYVGPQSLKEYAERFKFNNSVPADIPFEQGQVEIPTDDSFAVAEAASGYTRENKMSPMQGMLIAAAVANDGIMMEPYMIERVAAEGDGEVLYRPHSEVLSKTMSPTSAASVRELMRETVEHGTSRKAFRQLLKSRRFAGVEFGGKTGSLTGTDPAGKCDWFVGYARMAEHRIAVAALTINEKVWRVKASTLAATYLEDQLKQLQEGGPAPTPGLPPMAHQSAPRPATPVDNGSGATLAPSPASVVIGPSARTPAEVASPASKAATSLAGAPVPTSVSTANAPLSVPGTAPLSVPTNGSVVPAPASMPNGNDVDRVDNEALQEATSGQ